MSAIEYRLFRRGVRTSAAFNQMESAYFSGGGGSWDYAALDGGTDWTQTSTLELKSGWRGRLLAPLVRRRLSSGMREAMTKAKSIMETGSA